MAKAAVNLNPDFGTRNNDQDGSRREKKYLAAVITSPLTSPAAETPGDFPVRLCWRQLSDADLSGTIQIFDDVIDIFIHQARNWEIGIKLWNWKLS